MIVFFLSICSQYGLGMQWQGSMVKARPAVTNKRRNTQLKRPVVKERPVVVKKRSKLPIVKMPPVLDRNFHENQTMLAPQEEAICIEPFIETMDTGIIPGVSLYDINEKVLIKLFNNNDKVAKVFSKMPAYDATERFGQAKKAEYYWPIAIEEGKYLSLEHYMCLTQRQALVLSDSIKNGTIDRSEVENFKRAMNVLKKFDPKLMSDENEKKLTDSIRLDLSLSDRQNRYFENNTSLSKYAAVTTMCSAVILGSYILNDKYFNDACGVESKLEKLYLGSCGLTLGLMYKDYKNIVAQAQLLQPTLTQLLNDSSL